MKLNNHGWGMRDMIIYTCILLLFLFFAAYSVSSLYDSIDNSKTNVTDDNEQPVDDSIYEEEKEKVEEPIILDLQYYNEMEIMLKEATLNYLNVYPTDLSNDILKVISDTLINLGFMDEIYDQTNTNKCMGYSNVYQDTEGDYVIKSYISCGNYVTEGY